MPDDSTSNRARRDPELERKWRGLIARAEGSEGTFRAFCREEGLKEASFHSWRRELRRRDAERAAAGEGDGSRFVEVSAPRSRDLDEPRIEVRLRSGVRVRVRSGVDRATLSVVLDALQGASC